MKTKSLASRIVAAFLLITTLNPGVSAQNLSAELVIENATVHHPNQARPPARRD